MVRAQSEKDEITKGNIKIICKVKYKVREEQAIFNQGET